MTTAAQGPKIAVDAHVIEGKPQGSRTTLTRLLQAVAQLGRSSDLALYSSNPEVSQERIGESGFQFVRLRKAGSLRRLLISLPRVMNRNGVETSVWQYISSPFVRGRRVVVIHDVLPYTHQYLFPFWFRVRCQLLFFMSMCMAWRIIVVSEFSRREISRLFPFLGHKVATIVNGPSFSPEVYFAEPPSRAVFRPYIITVGRVEARKNFGMLARAFLAAKLTGVDLRIVGRFDLDDSGARLPEEATVILMQDVTDEELVDLYRNASLFVYPSSAEGFGLPLLDATLFGVPIISSDRTAMPEIGGGMAWFFDPTSPGAEGELRDRIARHFSNDPIAPPSFEQRQAQMARFNWRAGAVKLLQLLDSEGQSK